MADDCYRWNEHGPKQVADACWLELTKFVDLRAVRQMGEQSRFAGIDRIIEQSLLRVGKHFGTMRRCRRRVDVAVARWKFVMEPNDGPGVTFSFSIPCSPPDRESDPAPMRQP